MRPIYLDYAATTPIDERVAAAMQECMTQSGLFANPASVTHIYGEQAREKIETAREQVATLINANCKEIIWTSGATEANNLALQGIAKFYRNKGQHIITATTEHKSVLDTCAYLHKQGFAITYLKPEKNGLIDLEKIKAAIRQDTILISIMHVNNETGVIQDIQAIGTLCRDYNIYFHVDAAQSVGKLPINLAELPVDLMSFSAHKIYGPKGIGALYLRSKPRIRLEPLIYGGGHEQGLRSGTLATHQIVGIGTAFALAKQELAAEYKRLLQLSSQLWEGICGLSGIAFNGDLNQRVPNILNFSVAGVDGTSLLYALKDLALSNGSACTSATIAPSYVLKSLGISDRLAHSSLRISIGRFTTEEEVAFVISDISKKIVWLRSLVPASCK